jgi:hypothetical protein
MSRIKILATYVAAVCGALVAGLATLPYGWAKVVASILGGLTAVLSGSVGTVATVQRVKASNTKLPKKVLRKPLTGSPT